MSIYEPFMDCQIPELARIYDYVFGEKFDGSFVEVGAFDGQSFSNTAFLADLGWEGLYIEPIPEHAERCRDRHAYNNVKVVESAVGSSLSSVEMWVGDVLSTASEKARKNFGDMDWAEGLFTREKVKKIEVRQNTLDAILQESNFQKDFDVLVIDVEGYEWEVLRNFKIKNWNPKMIIIELHDMNANYAALKEECENIVKYFYDNDYRVALKDATNTVYIKR